MAVNALSSAIGRRELQHGLLAVVSVGSVVSLPCPASAARYLSEVNAMGKKVKALRATVRQGGAVEELRSLVQKESDSLLKKNLAVAMAAIAPGLGLPEDSKASYPAQQQRVEVLPLLLKGHLLELDQALADKKGFDPYISKTTKLSYPGGKVERELEEVEETVDEFLQLASISSASTNNLKKK
eukprot:CAMPEP_0119330046 /NCGR_PEP_ID=MMETSP1333-20130426/77370_1 /TAXON_ID=418940 /ORGANISM="Scyphosphaera apsteinii, Strain RCC1455" /LENGTH=183 /DNA_ID=CAMNT_0007339325 /DNA_START=121 /DNA_END=672 /DNA_ORIENTATION=-